jgi:peroxiredoxin Q/BCP
MAEKDVQLGKRAPDFTLPDTSEGHFHLNIELARGPVVLLFYPNDFGIICSLEMKTFHGMRSELNSKGVTIVGISRNSIMTHKQWMESMNFHVRLLSDEEGNVCELYAGLQDSGLLKGHPRRAVFILDRFGIIRYVWISKVEGLTPPFEEVRERALFLES